MIAYVARDLCIHNALAAVDDLTRLLPKCRRSLSTSFALPIRDGLFFVNRTRAVTPSIGSSSSTAVYPLALRLAASFHHPIGESLGIVSHPPTRHGSTAD